MNEGGQIVLGVGYVFVIICVISVLSIFIPLAVRGVVMILICAEGMDLAVYQGGENRTASDHGDYPPVHFRVFLRFSIAKWKKPDRKEQNRSAVGPKMNLTASSFKAWQRELWLRGPRNAFFYLRP